VTVRIARAEVGDAEALGDLHLERRMVRR